MKTLPTRNLTGSWLQNDYSSLAWGWDGPWTLHDFTHLDAPEYIAAGAMSSYKIDDETYIVNIWTTR